jgi:hypothetical protein
MSPSRTRSDSAAPTGRSSCGASESGAHAWLNPGPSLLEHRLRLGAALLSLTAAAALVVAARQPAALVLAAALVAGAGWSLRRRAAPTVSVRVNPEGLLELGSAEAAEAANAQFVSARLLVLGSSSYSLAVWADAVPPASFRRLCALARWAAGRPAN